MGERSSRLLPVDLAQFEAGRRISRRHVQRRYALRNEIFAPAGRAGATRRILAARLSIRRDAGDLAEGEVEGDGQTERCRDRLTD